jgi:uncharacterized protein YaiL (DUF2058 family)
VNVVIAAKCYVGVCLLPQGQQHPLAAGDVMQFGASTRTYTVQLGQSVAAAGATPTLTAAAAAEAAVEGEAAAAAAPPKKRKRARVMFADDADADSTAAAAAAERGSEQAKRNKLEQVMVLDRAWGAGAEWEGAAPRLSEEAVVACRYTCLRCFQLHVMAPPPASSAEF